MRGMRNWNKRKVDAQTLRPVFPLLCRWFLMLAAPLLNRWRNCVASDERMMQATREKSFHFSFNQLQTKLYSFRTCCRRKNGIFWPDSSPHLSIHPSDVERDVFAERKQKMTTTYGSWSLLTPNFLLSFISNDPFVHFPSFGPQQQ